MSAGNYVGCEWKYALSTINWIEVGFQHLRLLRLLGAVQLLLSLYYRCFYKFCM